MAGPYHIISVAFTSNDMVQELYSEVYNVRDVLEAALCNSRRCGGSASGKVGLRE